MSFFLLYRLDENNNEAYNAEDIKLETPFAGFYPSIGDFSIPISLSAMWKKKMDVVTPETFRQIQLAQQEMEAVENREYESEEEEEVEEQPKVKPKPKSRSPNKDVNNNSAPSSSKVTAYEHEVKNDHWPVDCIKDCDTVLTNLDNFNQHMNDHWSEDKCCPVCGLLINSKRFNFKQHLKIHTGEKPFQCPTCNRSFRQKAHMMKHVTTHRSTSIAQTIAVAAR